MYFLTSIFSFQAVERDKLKFKNIYSQNYQSLRNPKGWGVSFTKWFLRFDFQVTFASMSTDKFKRNLTMCGRLKTPRTIQWQQTSDSHFLSSPVSPIHPPFLMLPVWWHLATYGLLSRCCLKKVLPGLIAKR